MTKFADQLFDDLMREHGSGLADSAPPAHPQRHVAARWALLSGGGTLAIAGAVVGVLVAGSGSPAPVAMNRNPAPGAAGRGAPYTVTKNPGGSITLAVYKKSGIAGANARLRQLGDDQVVVVPVEAGCPKVPPPAASARGAQVTTETGVAANGSITVNAQGIPAGDILVVGVETSGQTRLTVGALTSPPAPACMPPPAAGAGGSQVTGRAASGPA